TPTYTTTALSYQVTGLIDGTTYYFVVRAKDAAGNEDTNIIEKSATPTAPDTTLPNVTSTTPVDTATGVAVTTTIIVQFSEAMNKTNTEGAFSTSPATTGTFSWNAAGDKLTYTPSASLSGGTTYTVTITPSAKDLSGNPLDGDGDGIQDNPASKDNYVFSFTTAGGGTVNKYALVIGINTYKNFNNLQYCVNDAADWKTLLTGQGYTIHYLTDSQATEANVKNEIQWLVSTATANDYVAITFSGHGCNAGDVGLSGTWQGIACYDAASYTEVGIYKDSEMQSDLSTLASTHVFIYFDSCRSGGMTEVATTGRLVQMGCAANGYTYDGDASLKNGVWTWHTIYYYDNGYTCMEDNFAVAAPAASNWVKTNYPGNTMSPVQSDKYTGSFYL
ncbi:MAG: Ig-like domain-containing protein, partial [Candidatus Thermoplasmatota archaeon]|nr:Ig-like domain-containing protein [Candidatus Thermoplasmatota archaeon]